MLGIVSVALFLISIDGSVLFTALPVLSKDLGATAGQQLWILNAYTVVMSGLLLGAGTLGDKLGHRRMFLFGMAVFGVASLACALAYSPGTLIAARVLLAVGAAPMMPATLALIRLTFTDARQRNTAIAVWSMVSVVGAVVGPVVGGLLLEHFHWGSVFLVNVPSSSRRSPSAPPSSRETNPIGAGRGTRSPAYWPRSRSPRASSPSKRRRAFRRRGRR